MKVDLDKALLCLIGTGCVLINGCHASGSPEASGRGAPRQSSPEQKIIQIPLEGELLTTCGRNCAEVSGLAWYDDHLVILPQYPQRFGNAGEKSGRLFTIPRQSILDFIDGRSSSPIRPLAICLDTCGLEQQFKPPQRFEGYEAIAFQGDRAILTIETKAEVRGGAESSQSPSEGEKGPGSGFSMKSYVVAGKVLPNASGLRLDRATLREIGSPRHIRNAGDESVIVTGEGVLTLFEAYGRRVNARPVAHLFDSDLEGAREIPFPSIEYRITDATAAHAKGRFWVINCFYPGDAGHLNSPLKFASSRRTTLASGVRGAKHR